MSTPRRALGRSLALAFLTTLATPLTADDPQAAVRIHRELTATNGGYGLLLRELADGSIFSVDAPYMTLSRSSVTRRRASS